MTLFFDEKDSVPITMDTYQLNSQYFFDEENNLCIQIENKKYYVFQYDAIDSELGVEIIKLIEEKDFLQQKELEKQIFRYLNFAFMTGIFVLSNVAIASANEGFRFRNFGENTAKTVTTEIFPNIEPKIDFFPKKEIILGDILAWSLASKNFFNGKNLGKTLNSLNFIKKVPELTNFANFKPYHLTKIPEISNSIPAEFLIAAIMVWRGIDFLSEKLEKKIELDKKNEKEKTKINIEKIVILKGGSRKEIYEFLNTLIENFYFPIPFPLSESQKLASCFIGYLLTLFLSKCEEDFDIQQDFVGADKQKEERRRNLENQKKHFKITVWLQEHWIFASVILLLLLTVAFNRKKILKVLFSAYKEANKLIGISVMSKADADFKDKLQIDTINELKEELKALLKKSQEYIKELTLGKIMLNKAGEILTKNNEEITFLKNKVQELETSKTLLEKTTK
jgi:hypothetical protein